MKKLIVAGLAAALLVVGFAAYAHPKHSNLHAAHELVQKAIGRIDAAQKANEFDLGGHAAKAKDLLAQAETELKAAAGAANDKDDEGDKDKDHEGDKDKDDDDGGHGND